MFVLAEEWIKPFRVESDIYVIKCRALFPIYYLFYILCFYEIVFFYQKSY